jgi:hypothetical protein
MGPQIEPFHQPLQQGSVSAVGITQAHRGIHPVAAPILAAGSAATVPPLPSVGMTDGRPDRPRRDGRRAIATPSHHA